MGSANDSYTVVRVVRVVRTGDVLMVVRNLWAGSSLWL